MEQLQDDIWSKKIGGGYGGNVFVISSKHNGPEQAGVCVCACVRVCVREGKKARCSDCCYFACSLYNVGRA